VIKGHHWGVIQFSGGIDSLVVAHLLREHRDELIVVFTDTGDMYPHSLAYAQLICDAWGYKIMVARGDALAWGERHGLASHVVPSWASCGDVMPGTKSTLQPYYKCCWDNFWGPMRRLCEEIKTPLIIRGYKLWDIGGDSNYHHTSDLKPVVDCVIDGVEYYNPLLNWSDEDVWGYIKRHNLPIQPQYEMGCRTSLECMECTGWLEPTRLDFTREFYPVKFERLKEKMRAIDVKVQQAISEHNEYMSRLI
jgi:phosphoadenosine phosphosulfate reductase